MTDVGVDRRFIACNYSCATSIAAEGALAFVAPQVGGNLRRSNGQPRVRLTVRSRSGRWVQRWEPMRNLTNFRLKTIPPGHPRYDDDRFLGYDANDATLERLRQAAG